MACSGPDNTKWESNVQACGGTSQQTSCDEQAQDTCYYAFLIDSGDKASWFSGKLISGQGLKIHTPDLLGTLGINAGDVVNKINGALLTDEASVINALAAFTETAPASVFSATHLLGKYQLSLAH